MTMTITRLCTNKYYYIHFQLCLYSLLPCID